MKNKIFVKAISFLLAISVILPSFLLMPVFGAEEDTVSVVYNRGYEDGWNYENGFDLSSKHMLDAGITYTKMSASRYDYYLRISPHETEGGYLGIPLPEDGLSEGKVFLEFMLKAGKGVDIGGILMLRKEGEDSLLTHPVALNNGRLVIFGEDVGDAPESFEEVSLTFDLGYNNGSEMLALAEYKGVSYERVYSGTASITGVWLGAQENFGDRDRAGDEYYVDSLKLYYGTEEKCELEKDDYGSAVDTALERDFPILGSSDVGGYLSGYPELDRLYETDAPINVIYNRNFSEGWTIENGLDIRSTLRENEVGISSDYAAEVNRGNAGFLNYYMEFVQRNNKNGFARMDTTVLKLREGVAYFEFDIKACAGANIPGIVEFITSGTPAKSFKGASIVDGELYVLDQKIGKIGEEWCHVTIRLDFDYGKNNLNNKDMHVSAWVGSASHYVETTIAIDPAESAFPGISNVRIGRLGSAVFREGDWYGIDNIQLYISNDGPRELKVDNYGVLVKADKTKDFVIDGGFGEPEKAEIAEGALNMRVNSDNALIYGKKVALYVDENGESYGGPYKVDGKVMVPVDVILDYTSTPYQYNSGGLSIDIFSGGEYRSFATDVDDIIINGASQYLSHAPTVRFFGGERVLYICLDDIETIFEGYYVTYDEVGFISICKYDDYLDRDLDEEFMRGLMKRFVYDQISPEEFYERSKENTNNFDHPYLYVKQDRFDYLYDVYHSTPYDEDIYDPDLIVLIEEQIKLADTQMKKYANFDQNGNYLGLKLGQWQYGSSGMASWKTNLTSGTNHSISIAPYPDSAGYDPAGGRLNVLTDGDDSLAAVMHSVGFAYQLTKDEKYVSFGYDWALAFCQWPHWGPAHYLNAANAARYIALGYDWLYDGFIEAELDPSPIVDGIYKHTTYTAWRSVNNLSVEFLRIDGSTSSPWWRHIGNWNPICSVGVLSACLVSFDNPEYVEKAAYTASMDIYYLGQNGFNYYGFDGSYRESSGYWAATARMSVLNVAIVEGVLGTSLGLEDAPGMDITNYFGYNLQSSDYVSWNYHDDWVTDLPSYWYFLSAEIFDNPDFAAIRKMHIGRGKKRHRYDILWYDKEMIERGSDSLGLDYVFSSIDGVTSRSSWDSGSLYVGMMGGFNNVAHGQYDSGNWIYENAGTRWFVDLGADDYNLYGGGLAKGYYKYSAEGNNTVAITSQNELIPHGQVLDAGGQVVSSVVNKYGTATVFDQSSVYGGSDIVSYARRGMLLTNDRKTVVIQDEINLVYVQDLYWYAHFDVKNEVDTYEISSDGKTVYMTSYPDENGEVKTLRVSLVTANRGFKFEVWDTYNYMLEATPERGYSYEMKGIDEGDRSHIRKLVINGKGVLKFELAVVIELIDPENPVEVGYQLGWDNSKNALPPMSEWVPSKDTRKLTGASIDGEKVDVESRPRPTVSELVVSSMEIDDLLISGKYLGEEREEFFRLLTRVEYILNYYGRDLTGDEILDAIDVFDRAKSIYDHYESRISEANEAASDIAKSLLGMA